MFIRGRGVLVCCFFVGFVERCFDVRFYFLIFFYYLCVYWIHSVKQIGFFIR